MPKKTTKSKLKTNNPYAAHAQDKTDFGFIEMPPGITGGVAQVTKCYFGTYKKGENEGERYFMAIATGIEPVTAPNGAQARGATIQLMEPICETTTRAGKTTPEDDHVASVMNEIRKMGVDTSEVSCFEDLEELAQAVQDAAPYVRFATSQGEPTKEFPDPRIWHNWNGLAEGYEQEETDDVEEEGVGEIPEHGEAPPDDEVPFDTADINSIAEAADYGDTLAEELMTEKAAEAGIDDDFVKEANDWSVVADAIVAESEEEKVEEGPEKGSVYQYKPPRARKSVEVQVTAIFKTKRTCNVKNLETNKVIKNVSWEKLT